MMETPKSYSSNRRALQLTATIRYVTPVHTEHFVTVLFVGDDELLNGLFPAAGYGFILSLSTLNDTGVSATCTFEFFSFLSLP